MDHEKVKEYEQQIDSGRPLMITRSQANLEKFNTNLKKKLPNLRNLEMLQNFQRQQKINESHPLPFLDEKVEESANAEEEEHSKLSHHKSSSDSSIAESELMSNPTEEKKNKKISTNSVSMSSSKDEESSHTLTENESPYRSTGKSHSPTKSSIMDTNDPVLNFLNIVQKANAKADTNKNAVFKEEINQDENALLDINFSKASINEQVKPIKVQTRFEKITSPIKKFIKSKYFSIIFTINILIALFLDNLRLIFFPKSWDHGIEIIMSITFFFFLSEILLHFILLKSYRFSFFFYADILAVFGLIPEISIFQEASHDYSDHSNELYHIFLGNTNVSKTIRVTSSGSRISRVFTIFNVLRNFSIFQIGKIYKNNVDDFLKQTQINLFENKHKENIRLMRRNTLTMNKMRDKMNFFRKVHSVINHADNEEDDFKYNGSQINPVIIKNFYDYTMKNELKNRKTSKMLEGGRESNLNPNHFLGSHTSFSKLPFKNKTTIESNDSQMLNVINFNITNINVHLPNKIQNNEKNIMMRSPKISATGLNNYNLFNQSPISPILPRRNLNLNRRKTLDVIQPIRSIIEEKEEENEEEPKRGKMFNPLKKESNKSVVLPIKKESKLTILKIADEGQIKKQNENKNENKNFINFENLTNISNVPLNIINKNEIHQETTFFPTTHNSDKHVSEGNNINSNTQLSHLSNYYICECSHDQSGTDSNKNSSKALSSKNLIQHQRRNSYKPKYSVKRRFSLISKDVLAKVNVDSLINETHSIDRRESIAETVMRKQSQIMMGGGSFLIPTNHGDLPMRKCDFCGGLEIVNPALEDSINTYLHDDDNSRRSSLELNMVDNRFRKLSKLISHKSLKNLNDQIKISNPGLEQTDNPHKGIFDHDNSPNHLQLTHYSPHLGPTFKLSNKKSVNFDENKNKVFNFDHSPEIKEVLEDLKENEIDYLNITNHNQSYGCYGFLQHVGQKHSRKQSEDQVTEKSSKLFHSNTDESQSDIPTETQPIVKIQKIRPSFRRFSMPMRKEEIAKKNKHFYKLHCMKEFDEMNSASYPNLGVTLSKITTIRLICLILLILFVLPYLSSSTYDTINLFKGYDLQLLFLENYLVTDVNMFLKNLNNTIFNQTFIDKYKFEILSFGFNSRELMCNFPKLCDIFANETLYKNLTMFQTTRPIDRSFIALTNLFMVYNIESENHIEKGLQIFKIIFVTILLFIGAFLFLKDSNREVVIPLEETYKSILELKFSHENFFHHYHLGYNNKNEIENLENLLDNDDFLKIQKYYIKLQKMIISVYGFRVFDYLQSTVMKNPNIKRNNDIDEGDWSSDSRDPVRIFAKVEKNPFFKLNGVILSIEVSNLKSLCKEHGTKITKIMSRIVEICDLTSFESFGQIIKIEQNTIYIFWEQGKNYNVQAEPLVDPSRKDSFTPSLSKSSFAGFANSKYSESSYIEEEEEQAWDDVEVQQIYSNVKKEENKIQVLPELGNKSVLQQNASNFALITAIKIYSRIFNDEVLNPNLIFNKTSLLQDLSIELKMSLHKGNIYNFITNSASKLESVYTGYTLKETTFMNEINKFKFQIIYSNKIAMELHQLLLKYSREVSIIMRRNPFTYLGKTKKLFAFDLDFNKLASKNPYISEHLKVDKEHGIIIRKNLIEHLNLGTFDIEKVIKYDTEINYGKLKDLSFLEFFREGTDYYELNNKYHAAIFFNKALIFKQNDVLTKYLLNDIEYKK